MSTPLSSSKVKAEVLESRNPRTGELIKSWQEMQWPELDTLLSDLHKTFTGSKNLSWSSVENIDFRLSVCAEIAKLLKDENIQQECAQLICDEMGKNVHEARGEVAKCAMLCDYFVQNGKQFMKPIEMPPLSGTAKCYIAYQPLGIVFSIMPWNFPFWQVFRAAIPNFVAGNTMVLKHAPNCIGCATKIEELVARAVENAGGKSGDAEKTTIFKTAVIQANAAESVLRDDRVQGVCLTGSEGAGRAVASLAGSLLKKCVVELGGNDGYLILKNADVDRAVDSITKGRLLNTGQVCIAPKRIICETPETKKEFEDKLVSVLKEKQDQQDFSVLVNKQAKDEVKRKVEAAIKGGARCIFGNPDGGAMENKNLNAEGGDRFYNPIILTDMAPSNESADTEIFGPVFTIMEAAGSAEKCVEMCNNSHFGLGSAVFVDPKSEDEMRRGEEIAGKLQSGMAWVNDFVKSDPSLPFGGIKASGIGRECGWQGVHEFCNVKTVVVSDYAGR